VRISKGVRYREKFVPHASFTADADTLALYRFEEGAGNVLKDSSGHDHHGQISGAKWVRADDAATKDVAGWHGWPKDAPNPAIEPFDAKQARKHQQEWAEYLGVPVEYENTLGMKFVLIPPGEFLMGSTKGDPNEAPVHKIAISAPYYLGVYEVTQEEYKVVVAENPSKFPGDRLPVESVTSDEAMAYCRQIAEREGLAYRLPTEAEWELACRAGTATDWSFGDEPAVIGEHAWCKENGGGKTHLVGGKKPNAFGLFDMHGNVFEYCADYTAAYSAAPAVDPQGPKFGRYRGFRGGSWFFPQFDSRSADRQDKEWPARGSHVGFRVALDVNAMRQSAKNATQPSVPDQVVDLLKLVDVERDSVKGKWTRTADGLASDAGVPYCRLKLPHTPPPEYDFRVEFTAQGGNDILQLFTAGGRSCTWPMGAWGGKHDGFDTVKDHPLTREGTNIIGGPTSIRRGQRHTSVVQVRRDSIAATIDGKLVVRHATDGSDLGIPGDWSIGEGAIGLGTTFDAVVFHKVELVVSATPDLQKPARKNPVAASGTGGGYALRFDDAGERLEIPDLKFPQAGPWTVEGWVTPRDPLPTDWATSSLVFRVSEAALVVKHTGPGGIKWSAGGPATKAPPSLNSSKAVEVNKPVHVALMRGPEGVSFYLNGVLQGEPLQILVSGRDATLDFCVADPRWHKIPFHGDLDEFRVSSVARYHETFTPKSRFEPDADTLALYHFDEGEGDLLKDSSGKERHGKIDGAKWVKAETGK
jgi:formylglycine-generating enzyme required for sulfatase activity